MAIINRYQKGSREPVDWSKYQPKQIDSAQEQSDAQQMAEYSRNSDRLQDLSPPSTDQTRSMFSKTLDMFKPDSSNFKAIDSNQAVSDMQQMAEYSRNSDNMSMAKGLSSLTPDFINSLKTPRLTDTPTTPFNPAPAPASAGPDTSGFFDGLGNTFKQAGNTVLNATDTMRTDLGKGINAVGDAAGWVADQAGSLTKKFGADSLKAQQNSPIMRGFTTPNLENKNLWDTTAGSLMAGGGDITKSAGNIVDLTGENLGSVAEQAGFTNFANDIRQGSINLNKDFSKTADKTIGDFSTAPDHEFSWHDLLDPQFYATSVARSVPMTAALMPTSLAGGEVLGALKIAKTASPFVQHLLKAGGAGIFSGGIEAATEAGGVYEDARSRGMSVDQAQAAANKSFLQQWALLAGTNALEFATAFMPKGISKALDTKLGAAARFGASALQEGGEEVAQEAINRHNLGDPITWDSNMKEQFAVGTLMGAGFGTAGLISSKMESLKNRVIEKMDDETKAEFASHLNEARAAGVPEEEATMQALDSIVQLPEGQKLADEALQEVKQSAEAEQQAKAPVEISNETLKLMDQTKAEEQAAIEQHNAIPKQSPDMGQEESVYGSLEAQDMAAVVDQYNLLRSQMENKSPRIKGGLTFDQEGTVTGAFPPVAATPQWLQDFKAAHGGKNPNQQELADLAGKHIAEGYQDGGVGRIPSRQEQELQQELDHITQLYEQAPESEKPGLMETAQHLMDALTELQSGPTSKQETAAEGQTSLEAQNNHPKPLESPASETVIQQPNEQKPAATKASGHNIGDVVMLKGKNNQKFTITGIKGNMVSLKSESGGEIPSVHVQALSKPKPVKTEDNQAAMPFEELGMKNPEIRGSLGEQLYLPEDVAQEKKPDEATSWFKNEPAANHSIDPVPTEPAGKNSAYPDARVEVAPIVKGTGVKLDYKVETTKPTKNFPNGRERVIVTRGNRKFYFEVGERTVTTDDKANFRAAGGLKGMEGAFAKNKPAENPDNLMPDMVGGVHLMNKQDFFNFLDGKDYRANIDKRKYKDVPADFKPTHLFRDGRKLQVDVSSDGRVANWHAEDGQFESTAMDSFDAVPINLALGDGTAATIQEARDVLSQFKRNDYLVFTKDEKRQSGRLMNEGKQNVQIMLLDDNLKPKNHGRPLVLELTDPAILTFTPTTREELQKEFKSGDVIEHTKKPIGDPMAGDDAKDYQEQEQPKEKPAAANASDSKKKEKPAPAETDLSETPALKVGDHIQFRGNTYFVTDISDPTYIRAESSSFGYYLIEKSLLQPDGEGAIVNLYDGPMDSNNMTMYWNGHEQDKILLEEELNPEFYPEGTDTYDLPMEETLYRILEEGKFDTGEYISQDHVLTMKEALDIGHKMLQKKYGKQTEEAKTPPAAPLPEPAPVSESQQQTPVKAIADFNKRLRAGDVTAQEVKDQFDYLVNNEEAIKADILDVINKSDKHKRKRKETKAEMVQNRYIEAIKDLAYADRDSFVMEIDFSGGSREDRTIKAVKKQIDTMTDESIQAHAAKKQAYRDQQKKTIENPETLQELRSKKDRVGLNDDEQARLDELEALNAKEKKAEAPAAAPAASIQGEFNFDIKETKHTKSGEPLFVVTLKDRVSPEDYKKVKLAMSKLGVGWSKFTNGFNFKSDPTDILAKTFGGEVVQPEESGPKVNDRERVASRLLELADNMQSSIDAKYADRLTNTTKRAAEAAGAAKQGDALKRIQGIMRNISQGMLDGNITHLDGISARTHIETLDSLLTRRAYENMQKNGEKTLDRNGNHIRRDPTLDDINGMEYPKPVVPVERLSEFIDGLLAKRISGTLRTVAKIDKLIYEANKKKSHIVDVSRYQQELQDLISAAKTAGDVKTKRRGRDYETTIHLPQEAEAINDYLMTAKRLQTMGLETPEQLRAALREYLTFRDGTGVSEEEKKKREMKLRESETTRMNIPGYFPTPKPMVEDLLDRANIEPGMKVLEPSAGKGNIAEALRDTGAEVDVVEYHSTLSNLLEEKGFNVVGSDFLEYSKGGYDRIVMNPPFENGQDIQHVQHAFDLLKPGGRIVAIMSAGPFSNTDKKSVTFRAWLQELGAESEPNAEGAFKSAERSTGVRTRTVVIDKPQTEPAAEQKSKRDVQTFLPQKKNPQQSGKQSGSSNATIGPVTRTQIINFITKEFHVPIGTGRYKDRARAIYKTFVNEMRLKSFGDFVAITHELGHRLDKRSRFSETKDAAIDAELLGLAHTLQIPNGMTNEEILSEGVAEFVRKFLFDPQQAQTDSPEFFRHFTTTLDKTGKIDTLYQLHNMMDRWYSQSASDRVRGVTDYGGKKDPIWVNFKEKLKRSKNKGYDMIYDELAGMDRVLHDMVGDTTALAGDKNPALLAWKTRGSAGRVKAFLEYGIMDDKGNKIGKSLKEILGSVPDLSVFRDYAEALRAKELHNQGKHKTPISENDADSIIDEVENGPDGQTYMDARDDLYAYQDAVTDELVRSGMLDPEKVEGWKEEHKFYVPFYRVMEEAGERSGGGKKADKKFANLGAPIKGMKAEGSSRNIVDPLESIIKNTYLFISLAERNKVGTAWAELANKTEDSAEFMVKVDNKSQVTSFTLDQIAEDLEAAGFDLSNPAIDLEKAAKVFTQTFTPSSTDKVLNVWVKGKIQQYQIRNQELYDAFLNLDPEPMKAWVKALSIPNQILRTGITLAPSFIPKNPMRSIFSLLVLSDSFTTPKDFMQLPAMMLKNVIGTGKKGDDYWKWASTGGAQSTLASIEGEYLKDSSDMILRGTWKQKILRGMKSGGIKPALHALRKLSEFGDEPIRLSEHQMALKKTGDATTAAIRSRDIDVDFSRFGTNTRTLNSINLFFNVALQGPEKIARSFKEHPVRTLMRGSLFITLPTLALLLANWDDEDYWELPQWRRDLFWNIPIGDGKFFSWPIPFELGVIFKMIPERLLADYYQKSNRSPMEELGSFAKTVKDVTLPTIIPTYLIPIVQWVTNKNLSTGTAIVPQRAMDERPENQVKPGTSNVAKMVGKAIGQSPIKIDQAISDTTSTLGKAIVGAADNIMQATGITKEPPKPAGEKGMFGKTFITSANDNSGDSVDVFYKKLEQSELAYKDKKVKGLVPLELKKLRKVQDDMAAMRSISDSVYSSEKLTPEQKRIMLDRMKAGITDAARKAVGKKPLDPTNLSKATTNAMMFSQMRSHKMDPQKIVDGMGKNVK